MAWAVISIFVHQVFLGPSTQSVAYGTTLSFLYTLQYGAIATNLNAMIKSLAKLAVIGTVLCATTSCASIFCGTKAKVTFDCNVKEKVNLTIDGVKYYDVTFPFTTKITRGFDDTIVIAEAEAYHKETVIIDKKFNPVAIINLCEVLGWAIDAATGAITKPESQYYQIEMRQK